MAEGKCVESDAIFSLDEQDAPQVMGRRTTRHTVRAGHVEIVGEQGLPPHKLITILQEHNVLGKSSRLDEITLARRVSSLY